MEYPGQPRVKNYSTEVATFPQFQEYPVSIKVQRSSVYVPVTISKSAFYRVVTTGNYLLLSDSQNSELIKIVGVDRINKRIVLERKPTVDPVDTRLRMATPIESSQLCIRNNGVSNIYINGEALSPGERVEWDSMEGRPPVVIYGADRFQVANGRIPVDADSATVVRRFIPTSITPTVIMDARLTDDLTEENIEVDSNNQNLVAGVHYTLDLANNQLLAISPTTFPATGLFITIFR